MTINIFEGDQVTLLPKVSYSSYTTQFAAGTTERLFFRINWSNHNQIGSTIYLSIILQNSDMYQFKVLQTQGIDYSPGKILLSRDFSSESVWVEFYLSCLIANPPLPASIGVKLTSVGILMDSVHLFLRKS